MEYDVVVVGAGPSGLAAAIRLKQLAAAAGNELAVCVIEKGSEVGAHILSGAVFEPRALNELIPDWRERGAPLNTPATDDRFLYLTKNRALRLPTPPPMHNDGNYIISLGNLCRWLASQAEELGVEIYPGFAAAEVLYDENGRVRGVATGDMGIGRTASRPSATRRGRADRPRDPLRGGLPRLADEDPDPALSPARRARPARRSASRSCGRSRQIGISRDLSCIPAAGRSTAAPMAARSSTTSKTARSRSAS
jgi:electron-transferring-flavoprotein dehydrogenase